MIFSRKTAYLLRINWLGFGEDQDSFADILDHFPGFFTDRGKLTFCSISAIYEWSFMKFIAGLARGPSTNQWDFGGDLITIWSRVPGSGSQSASRNFKRIFYLLLQFPYTAKNKHDNDLFSTVNTITETGGVGYLTDQMPLLRPHQQHQSIYSTHVYYSSEKINQLTMLKDYTEVKRNAEDREAWRAMTRQPST